MESSQAPEWVAGFSTFEICPLLMLARSPFRSVFGVERSRFGRRGVPEGVACRCHRCSLGHPEGHFLILRHRMSLGRLQWDVG